MFAQAIPVNRTSELALIYATEKELAPALREVKREHALGYGLLSDEVVEERGRFEAGCDGESESHESIGGAVLEGRAVARCYAEGLARNLERQRRRFRFRGRSGYGMDIEGTHNAR